VCLVAFITSGCGLTHDYADLACRKSSLVEQVRSLRLLMPLCPL
jgi:hypothetical protein